MSARKLPVFETAIRGWWLLAKDWSVLLRIVWLPVGIIVALDFLFTTITDGGSGISPPYAGPDYRLYGMDIAINVDFALAIILGGLIVALWQRVQLTGQRDLSIFGLLAAWRNIGTLTTYWCGLILIVEGLQWLFSASFMLSSKVFLNRMLAQNAGLVDYPVLYRVLADLIEQGIPLLLALYIAGRLGLMLWARPAGGEGVLDRAWAAGAGNSWRIAAVIFVAIVPVMIFASARRLGPNEAESLSHFYLSFDLANLPLLIVAAGVISAAHRALLGGEDAGGATVSTGATERQSTA